MKIGKALGYTILGGVAAVAAAPFTGGASLLGATTLATSLAGAGTIVAVTGAYLAKKNNDENTELTCKFEEGIRKALQTFEGEKAYFNFIIGMVALGLAMANVDGEISDEEQEEIDEFIESVLSSQYPQYVKDKIEDLYKNTPNLMTTMRLYISKIDPKNYDVLRDFLHIVMLADNIQQEREIAFIAAFEQQILQLEYQPENESAINSSLNQSKNDMAWEELDLAKSDDCQEKRQTANVNHVKTYEEKGIKQTKGSDENLDKVIPNEVKKVTVEREKSIFPFNLFK